MDEFLTGDRLDATSATDEAFFRVKAVAAVDAFCGSFTCTDLPSKWVELVSVTADSVAAKSEDGIAASLLLRRLLAAVKSSPATKPLTARVTVDASGDERAFLSRCTLFGGLAMTEVLFLGDGVR